MKVKDILPLINGQTVIVHNVTAKGYSKHEEVKYCSNYGENIDKLPDAVASLLHKDIDKIRVENYTLKIRVSTERKE